MKMCEFLNVAKQEQGKPPFKPADYPWRHKSYCLVDDGRTVKDRMVTATRSPTLSVRPLVSDLDRVAMIGLLRCLSGVSVVR